MLFRSHRWKRQFGMMEINEAKRLKDLDLQVQALTAERNAAQKNLGEITGAVGTSNGSSRSKRLDPGALSAPMIDASNLPLPDFLVRPVMPR